VLGAKAATEEAERAIRRTFIVGVAVEVRVQQD